MVVDSNTRAARIVEDFLAVSMAADTVRTANYIASDIRITFTGGRAFDHPAAIAAFNASRYRWVKKKLERTEVIAGSTDDEAVVYNSGTLFGEWPDGQAFAGNRYVDRFVVRADRIVQMDVWNDSAEMLLVRAGLATI